MLKWLGQKTVSAQLRNFNNPNLLHSHCCYCWMLLLRRWLSSCPKRRNHSGVSLVNGEACSLCDQNTKPSSYRGDIVLFCRPQLGKTTTLYFVFVPPFLSWFCSEYFTILFYCPLQGRRTVGAQLQQRLDERWLCWGGAKCSAPPRIRPSCVLT